MFMSIAMWLAFHIFIIKGGCGDLYSVNKVPHGSVTQRWYNSPSLGYDRRITIYTPAGYETSGKRYPGTLSLARYGWR